MTSQDATAPISFYTELTLVEHAAFLDRAIRDSFTGTRSYEMLRAEYRPSLVRTVRAWLKRREARRAARQLAASAEKAEIRDVRAWAARAARSSGFGGEPLAGNDGSYVNAA